MIVLRRTFFPAAGKTNALRAQLVQNAERQNAKGASISVSQPIVSPEPRVVVSNRYADMAALQAASDAAQKEPDLQARLDRIAALVTCPPASELLTVLVNIEGTIPTPRVVVRATLAPAVGLTSVLRDRLIAWAADLQKAGTAVALGVRQFGGPAEFSLTFPFESITIAEEFGTRMRGAQAQAQRDETEKLLGALPILEISNVVVAYPQPARELAGAATARR